MHEQRLKSSQSKSPCLQIMFNINSKNCHNNNILTNMPKPYHLDIDLNHNNPNKNYNNSSNHKNHKNTLNKTSINNPKPTVFFQQNIKSNNKNTKIINKSKQSVNETLKSTKHSNLNKNISGTFTKTNVNDQINQNSSRKSKKSKQSFPKNKYVRDKIIELMIKDYENGKITANNLKVAISSLIEKETNQSKLKSKKSSKTQKSRINIPSSYQSSLTNSLRNIGKNIPAKSKSQKMYMHSFIKQRKKKDQFQNQPQIIQRVIQSKDLASKIIIKGINSSLFLSNQWTRNNDSPQKNNFVDVKVINTSDSVKNLRKQMQKHSQNDKAFKNHQDVNRNKNQQKAQNQRHEQTQKILQYYISQLRNLSNKKDHQNSDNFYIEKYQQEVEKHSEQMISDENSQQSQQENEEDFDQYEMKGSSQSDMSAIIANQQSNQPQPILINTQTQKECQNHPKSHQQELPSFQHEQKFKAYLSSQLHNQNMKNTFSSSKKQIIEKKVKSATIYDLKRIDQVLHVIKQQINSSVKSQTKNQNQQKMLQNLISLIEKQKNKASSELKFYSLLQNKKQIKTDSNQSLNSKKQSKENHKKEDQIDQNQIINSFRKKIFNKNSQKFPKIIQQQKNQSLGEFGLGPCPSLTSLNSTSSNHVSKTKITQLNLDEIEAGLYLRLQEIQSKKDKEIQRVTQKFINDKISTKKYHQEKEIILKWFHLESDKLKSIKKGLIEGYKRAKHYFDQKENNENQNEIILKINLTKEKSRKMLKSISEKYLVKRQSIFYLQSYQRNIQTIEQFQDSDLKNNKKRQIKKRKDVVYIEYQSVERSFSSPSDQQQNYSEPANQTNNKTFSPKYQNIGKENQNQEPKVQQQSIGDFDARQYIQTIGLSEEEENGNGVSSYFYNQPQNQLLDYYRQQNQSQSQNQDWTQEETLNQTIRRIELQNINQNSQNDQLVPNISQANETLKIVVNKKHILSNKDQLFSPKKQQHQSHEPFSQELQQYNSVSPDHQASSESFQKINIRFSPKYLKFKFLTDEDKDDIFQFLFLDLCLQTFLEQSKNSKITKSIEKYISYLRKKKSLPKGFKTGLDVCKDYVTHIESYLLSNFLHILMRLQTPIGPSAKEMLKFMRDYDTTDSQSSQSDNVSLVLPIQVYEKFQLQPVNILKVQKYYDDEQRQAGRIKFLNSLKRFHTKSLFDSLNEMLDLQRNYGIWGKPFPWKKAINVDRKLSDSQLKQKLKRSAQKVIENCSYYCGVMLDKEESIFGKAKISEEYLHHIRQDRMSKMLSNDMLDNQQRWIFYDDEEIEVLISITKTVTNSIFDEAVQDIILALKSQTY